MANTGVGTQVGLRKGLPDNRCSSQTSPRFLSELQAVWHTRPVDAEGGTPSSLFVALIMFPLLCQEKPERCGQPHGGSGVFWHTSPLLDYSRLSDIAPCVSSILTPYLLVFSFIHPGGVTTTMVKSNADSSWDPSGTSCCIIDRPPSW